MLSLQRPSLGSPSAPAPVHVIEWVFNLTAVAAFRVLASADDGKTWTAIPGCTGLSRTATQCTWSTPGPVTKRSHSGERRTMRPEHGSHSRPPVVSASSQAPAWRCRTDGRTLTSAALARSDSRGTREHLHRQRGGLRHLGDRRRIPLGRDQNERRLRGHRAGDNG